VQVAQRWARLFSERIMNSVGPNLWYTLDGWPLHGLRDQKYGKAIKNTGKT